MIIQPGTRTLPVAAKGTTESKAGTMETLKRKPRDIKSQLVTNKFFTIKRSAWRGRDQPGVRVRSESALINHQDAEDGDRVARSERKTIGKARFVQFVWRVFTKDNKGGGVKSSRHKCLSSRTVVPED